VKYPSFICYTSTKSKAFNADDAEDAEESNSINVGCVSAKRVTHRAFCGALSRTLRPLTYDR